MAQNSRSTSWKWALVLCFGFVRAVFMNPTEIPIPPQEERSDAEVVLLEVRDGLHDNQSSQLQLNIQAFGKVHNLKLIPSDSIFSPNFEEFVTSSDEKTGTQKILKVVNTRSPEMINEIHSNLYTDDTGEASLLVKRREDGTLIVEGIVNHEIRIEPSFGKKTVDNWVISEVARDTGAQEANHVAYKRREVIETRENACRSVAPNFTVPIAIPNMQAQERALPSVVTPELMVVLDYTSSAKFNFDLNLVKKYLAIFYNSVNRRYDTIPSPKIKILLDKIVLTKNQADESFVVHASNSLVDSGRTLDGFGKWLNQHSASPASFDFAVWMTGLDLGSASNNGWSDSTLGLGFVGGVCMVVNGMDYNVVVAEDIVPKYTGIHTHVHELAHLLGAAHDGDKVDNPPGNPGAQECPFKEGYIMSYEFGTKKKFYFSPCSIRQMLFTVSSSQASCLTRSSNPSSSALPYDATLPGTLSDKDDQCRVRHGNTFFAYKPYEGDSCVKLWCAKKVSAVELHLESSGPALEGSSCGENKKCIDGSCV